MVQESGNFVNISQEMQLALDIIEALFGTEGVTVEELVKMSGWGEESVRDGLLNLQESLEEYERDIRLVAHEFQDMIVYRLEPVEAGGTGG